MRFSVDHLCISWLGIEEETLLAQEIPQSASHGNLVEEKSELLKRFIGLDKK